MPSSFSSEHNYFALIRKCCTHLKLRITQSLNVRSGTVLSVFQSFTQTSTTAEFTNQFKRLNAVLKEFEVKDHREQPFLKIKMIDLNRQTLPLYKRLDDKNKRIIY